MSTLGTRDRFRQWLSTEKQLTYTAYSKLTPDAKAKLVAQYRAGRHG